MKDPDNLVTSFMNRYGLDEASAKYVLDRAATLAKSLNEPDRKPNDYALARYLNERVIAIFALVADNRNNMPDISAINRSYILMVNEIKKIYARNPELIKINETICWQHFDIIEHIEHDLWEYSNNINDYGYSHNAQVNRLCISNGKEVPDFTSEIKKIVDEASSNVVAFLDKLESLKPTEERDWFIAEYTFTYGTDGSLLVNGVRGILKVKKTQAGSASAKLMEQATAKPNELFKPDLGNYSRNLSTTLSGMGFTETLRSLFFPLVSDEKGLIHRPQITLDEAKLEHIDTARLDEKLKELGATVQNKEISLSDIPF